MFKLRAIQSDFCHQAQLGALDFLSQQVPRFNLWAGSVERTGMDPGALCCSGPGMEDEGATSSCSVQLVSSKSLNLLLTTLKKKSLPLRTQSAQVCVFEVLQDTGSVYLIPNQ